MTKKDLENQASVVDALHAQFDEFPGTAGLLQLKDEQSRSVLDLLNAALAPLGVGPLALMVDGNGSVLGVGVVRRK